MMNISVVHTRRVFTFVVASLFMLAASHSSAYAIGCGGRRPEQIIPQIQTAIDHPGQPGGSAFLLECNDSGFTDWKTLGSQNLPVLSAAVGLYRTPTAFVIDIPRRGNQVTSDIRYVDWWIVFLATQTGQRVDPSYGVHAAPDDAASPNLKYFRGTELFSNVYEAPTLTAVVAVRYWAYSPYVQSHLSQIGAQKVQLIKDYSLAYLRAAWAIYGLAAGSGPASQYVVSGRTPRQPNRPIKPNVEYDPWANHVGGQQSGGLKFGGHFLPLAGGRSQLDKNAADGKLNIFDRAIEANSKRNEAGGQRDLLNKLESLWPSTSHTPGENLYGLTNAGSPSDISRLNALMLDDQSNVSYFLKWLTQPLPNSPNGIHLVTTYRIIAWPGFRVSTMELNKEGPNIFALSYSAANRIATFLYPWPDGPHAGGVNGLCWIDSPTTIKADDRPRYAVGEVSLTVPFTPGQNPLWHVVLGADEPRLDTIPQSQWPNFPKSNPIFSSVFNNAVEVPWVLNMVPAGAWTNGDIDNPSWTWIDSNPDPLNLVAHQSAFASGPHQHYFLGATDTLAISAGDRLYAWVYLDPINPPAEVMLQWNDGTWEHRAYWGTNSIFYGNDDTAGRRYVGPLPPTGDWVRLEVPANMVGLEGRTLNGMAYTLFGGAAYWDEAGKVNDGVPPTNLALGKSAQQSSNYAGTGISSPATLAVDGNKNGSWYSGSVTHTNNDYHAWWQVDLGDIYWLNQVNIWNRTDCCPDRLSDFYVLVSNDPFTSTDLATTLNQPEVSSYYVSGTAKSPSMIAILRPARYLRVQLAGTNYLALAEVEAIGPTQATSVPSPTTAYEGYHENVDCNYISGWVWDSNNSNARVNVSVFDNTTGTLIGSGVADLYRQDLFTAGKGDGIHGFGIATPTAIKDGQTHSVRVTVTGTNFNLGWTPRSFNSSSAGCTASPSSDVVWVEDALPAGSTIFADNDAWLWNSANPTPVFGSLSNQSSLYAGMHQHYFLNSSNTLQVNAGNKMVAYVYIDPQNLPSEIMLQWHDSINGWDHRATWGADPLAYFGPRYNMGALPTAGQWIRLEVPASFVGLEGRTVDGLAFTLYGGRATWDHAGKTP